MQLFMEGPFSKQRLIAEVHAGDTEYFLARQGGRLAATAMERTRR